MQILMIAAIVFADSGRLRSRLSDKQRQRTQGKRGLARRQAPGHPNRGMRHGTGEIHQQHEQPEHDGETDRRPANVSSGDEARRGSEVGDAHEIRDEQPRRHPLRHQLGETRRRREMLTRERRERRGDEGRSEHHEPERFARSAA